MIKIIRRLLDRVHDSGTPDAERVHRTIIASALFVVFFVGVLGFSAVRRYFTLGEHDILLGATFSTQYAEALGLDWQEVYLAALDDLGVRTFRIPVYWNDVEPQQGEYDFSDIDWMLSRAERRGANVILAIGMKTPRWPECHIPEWASSVPQEELREHVLALLRETVTRYRDDDTVVMWQVENEPLFAFGECPPPDREFLQREIAEVRTLDSRPIMTTESGELSTWVRAASTVDVLGVSMYRSVWNRHIGYFSWPVTPRYYSSRGQAVSALVDQIIVSELQAEPWGAGQSLTEMPLAEQYIRMNPRMLRMNISFARRVGFDAAYVWGIEWWYWMRTQGYPDIWDTGRELFRDIPAHPES